MIPIEELKKYSLLRGLNLGQAEVDYFQQIVLFIIYSKISKRIIFKGGTALQKCYLLERFSEDLDFSSEEDLEIEDTIKKGLRDFLIDFEIEKNNHLKGKNILLRIKGPLFNGNKNSFCRIQLDISWRERVYLEPNIVRIGKLINEVPSFDVLVMKEEEILAEKIRAIYTRNKARDVYDLNFLLGKGIKINENLANKKLEFDKITYSKTSLVKKILEKKDIWEIEMKPLLRTFIEFEKVLKSIKEKIK